LDSFFFLETKHSWIAISKGKSLPNVAIRQF
jgi:hypothetical protein